jgi:hypothetical protein
MSALMMVNAEMNKRLGKERSAASTEEFQDILNSLDDILQQIVRKVIKVKSDYDKNNSSR